MHCSLQRVDQTDISGSLGGEHDGRFRLEAALCYIFPLRKVVVRCCQPTSLEDEDVKISAPV